MRSAGPSRSAPSGPRTCAAPCPSTGAGAAPGDQHLGLAEVLILTGRPAMIAIYVERELEISRKPHGQDRQRVAAARMAFVALPADMQAELQARHPSSRRSRERHRGRGP